MTSTTLALAPAPQTELVLYTAVFQRLANGMLAAKILRDDGNIDVCTMKPSRKDYVLEHYWKIEQSADLDALPGRRGFAIGYVTGEEDFENKMMIEAEHRRELAQLNRKTFNFGDEGNWGYEAAIANHDPEIPLQSPWGPVQSATLYATGVVSVGTAGHGGILLSPERNAKVHPAWRSTSGAYEEDCAWAIVAHTFPDLFTVSERIHAAKSLKNSYPHQFQKVTGQAVPLEESYTLREEAFYAENKNRFVVTAALLSDHHEGMTEVYARRGGHRNPAGEERRFLVPSEEYAARNLVFVIDETRHKENTGPFSF